jgi:hypothetical protein
MIADTFPGKASSTSSGKDLKPVSFSERKRMRAIAGAKVAELAAPW